MADKNTVRFSSMKIDTEKWKKFISDETEYSIDAGFRHDLDSFSQEMEDNHYSLDWRAFPLEEIVLRKWVDAGKRDLAKNPQQVFEKFIALIRSEEIPQKVLLRKTLHKNTKNLTNDYALLAWSIRVLSRTIGQNHPQSYQPEIMGYDFLREIVQLSRFEDGPLRAKNLLAGHGISLIVEKWLPGTKFNGASLMTKSGMPIIGLTLFYDRIDNFWFTLLHELAHIWKHLHSDNDLYIDFFGAKEEDHVDNPEEKEADAIASKTLIPIQYANHNAFITHSESDVEQLANTLNIHPSIVAGRIRYDNSAWHKLSDYVNKQSVRALFNDIDWT